MTDKPPQLSSVNKSIIIIIIMIRMNVQTGIIIIISTDIHACCLAKKAEQSSWIASVI